MPVARQAPLAVAAETLAAVFFSGLLAFGLNANEFFLVQATSR